MNGQVVEAKVVDHIIPVRLGGSFWDDGNYQALCIKCHNAKSGRESSIERFSQLPLDIRKRGVLEEAI